MNKIKFIKRSERQRPKVSLVLLDWSVRESFHLLHYLDKQDVPRDWFEVNIIEYYSQISEPLKEFESHVDNWILLNMPEDCYYHKHLMYNVGIALSAGEIVMIGDSDAMVRETFIKTILDTFKENPKIAFHIDQFRNTRRDLYPFCYPDFNIVLGDGCINNVNGQTAGVLNTTDPIHNRNYGSCMCARREELIAIGGADEHIDYLGHICGPYDMTFRLVNNGLREIWHMQEFMMHTWHPGQAGADNYLGPHDGRHMSTTALEALVSGRIMPLRENSAIKALREGIPFSEEEILSKLINPSYLEEWKTENIETKSTHNRWSDYVVPMGTYNGFRITAEVDQLMARPIKGILMHPSKSGELVETLDGHTPKELKAKIDKSLPKQLISSIYDTHGSIGWGVTGIYIKRWIREYLGFGYRALKFHDRASILDFIKRSLRLPVDIFRMPRKISAEIEKIEDELGSMAVAIYFASLSVEHSSKPVAIIDHWLQRRFLADLLNKHEFPQFTIEMTSDANSIEEAFRRLEKDNHANIVVWGSLFSKFHTIFTTSTVSDKLIVV